VYILVFFTVLASVLVQGTSIPLAARLLRVDAPLVDRPRHPIEFDGAYGSGSQMLNIQVHPESGIAGRQLAEIGLPAGVLVVLIHRRDEYIVPRGGTIVEPGDTLLVLVESEALDALRALVEHAT